MATIKSITAPIITNPVGIDAVCQAIQLQLVVSLDWIEKSYGKALVITDNRIEDNAYSDYIIPKVYYSNREFISIEPDDTVTAFSFLYENPNSEEIVSTGYYKQTSNVNLIVFANTERISDISEDYLFIEVLKEQVLEALYGNPQIRTYIDESTIQIFKHFDNTWTDFDISGSSNKWLKHNYATFRINFDVSYNQDCPTIVNNVLLLEDGAYIELENGDLILLQNG